MSVITKRNLLGRASHVMAGIVMLAATFVAANASATVLAAGSPSYCKSASESKCLKLLSVKITSRCSTNPAGGKFDMYFTNPNLVDAPRTITVYLNGQEFFEDIGVAEPGQSQLTYGPLPNGQWRVVIGWQGRVFADSTANFTCAG
jgi:hypothetical protein